MTRDDITALRERLAQPEQSPLDRMAENARELGLDYEPVNTIANSEAIPEQISEPVAVPQFRVQGCSDWYDGYPDYSDGTGAYETRALYTTPPRREWVGLTDDDLKPVCDEYRILFGGWVHDFARAIEAKLKEKNA